MITCKIFFCRVLLIGFSLSVISAQENEKKSAPEVTTHSSIKDIAVKNLSNERVQSLPNAQIKKSSTKKRNIPKGLTDENEYSDGDFYEGKATEDYDVNHPLRTFKDSGNENLLFNPGKYTGSDYRYYDKNARRKRTVTLGSIFNNRDQEIRLPPEFLRILAGYGQHHVRNNIPYGRWNDINDSFDLPEEETESEEIYNRPENFFGRYYDQRFQNWENLPESNKFINHHGKNFMGFSKPRGPLYKRTAL